MTKKRCLFWHRKDLRINNNIGLAKAIRKDHFTFGVYILDPLILEPKIQNQKISPAKEWFIYKSLLELEKNWLNKNHSKLYILKGNPLNIIPKLAITLKINKVFWNINIEPYERGRDLEVENKLNLLGIETFKSWDNLIIEPENIKSKENKPYKIFTPFKNNWIAQYSSHQNYNKQDNNKISMNLDDDSKKELKKVDLVLKDDSENAKKIIKDSINKSFFESSDSCPCIPGEQKSNLQLEDFFNSGAIYNYFLTRDVPYQKQTSKISAGLNIGTISIRRAWELSEQLKLDCSNNSIIKSINVWQNELIWREFYQHSLYHFPELAKGAFRKSWEKFPWENNYKWIELWERGLTGIPIIDAAMRELKHTGWMHNRCRMIVASFLVKDLICDWKFGENIFMKYLVDGDLAANNGGWQWGASSGVDTKPLRIFNPHTQTKKFDPLTKYIKRWIPELSNVSPEDLIRGSIGGPERRGYPKPIINHNYQQSKFREIYKNFKRNLH